MKFLELIALIAIFTSINVHSSTKSNSQMISEIDSINTFAFGSCNDQSKNQPLWPYILKEKPQLWIWGGDNIYADTSKIEELIRKYNIQENHPGYKALKEKTPIIGIWDDHDYGHDNATYTNHFKYQSQQLFLDFLKVEDKTPRRVREGIYNSHTFGSGQKQAKFLMLDNRFFHSAPGANLLGKDQWIWLENELKHSKAKVHFIVAGLSVLSPKIPKTEEWADHPNAMKKLLGLIKKYKTKGVVFLSGDKHFASIFQRHGHLEFMSSGMTHTVPTRVLRAYLSRKYPLTFYGKTYGLVKIHWDQKPLKISMQIQTTSSAPVFTRKFKLVQNKWFATK